MAVPMTRRLLTVDEFQRLAAQGFFAPDERLELIRGEIIEMSPIGDRHALCVTLLNDLLADLRPKGLVSPQNPLRIPGQQSVPNPISSSSDAARTSARAHRTRGTFCWSSRLRSRPWLMTATSRSLSTPRQAFPRHGWWTSTPTRSPSSAGLRHRATAKCANIAEATKSLRKRSRPRASRPSPSSAERKRGSAFRLTTVPRSRRVTASASHLLEGGGPAGQPSAMPHPPPRDRIVRFQRRKKRPGRRIGASRPSLTPHKGGPYAKLLRW